VTPAAWLVSELVRRSPTRLDGRRLRMLALLCEAAVAAQRQPPLTDLAFRATAAGVDAAGLSLAVGEAVAAGTVSAGRRPSFRSGFVEELWAGPGATPAPHHRVRAVAAHVVATTRGLTRDDLRRRAVAAGASLPDGP
jgi:hypothetical protein